MRLSARMRAASIAPRPAGLDLAPRSRRDVSICTRNHGSMCVSAYTSSSVSPRGTRRRRRTRDPGRGSRSSRLSAIEAIGRRRYRASSDSGRSCRSRAPRSAFCSDSWNVRPIAITSPTDFICVVEARVGRREFLEREARNLDDDVVDRRLERGRRLAAGDVVLELVERVADRELRGDLRDRETRWPSTRAPSERDTRGFISMTSTRPFSD